MALPPLKCPNDPAHVTFRGTLIACDSHEVILDPDWHEMRRQNMREMEPLSSFPDYPVACIDCGAQVWRASGPITFVPSPGTMLLCDFSTGFRPPEMIKARVVIVISERERNRETCIVVPISTSENSNTDRPSVALPQSKYGFLKEDSWAKCDSPNSVAVRRLFRLRGHDGRRLEGHATVIDPADLHAVRAGVASAVGLP